MHEKCVMEWHIVIAEMMREAILTYQKFIRSKRDLYMSVRKIKVVYHLNMIVYAKILTFIRYAFYEWPWLTLE